MVALSLLQMNALFHMNKRRDKQNTETASSISFVLCLRLKLDDSIRQRYLSRSIHLLCPLRVFFEFSLIISKKENRDIMKSNPNKVNKAKKISRLFRNIKVRVRPENPLIVDISFISRLTGTVYLQYKSEKTKLLQSSTSQTPSTTHRVSLVRLRASSRYRYRIFLVSCHDVFKSRVHKFKTHHLPQNLRQSFSIYQRGTFSPGVIILCVNGVKTKPDFFQGYIGIDEEGYVVWFYQTPLREEILGIRAAGDFFQLKDSNMVITLGQSLGLPVLDAQIEHAAQIIVINALGETLAKQPLLCITEPSKIEKKNTTLAKFGWTHASWEDPSTPNTIYHLGLELRDPFYDANLSPPGIRLQLGETISRWKSSKNSDKFITSAFELIDPIQYRGTLSNESVGVPLDCNGNPPGLENQDWCHGNAISKLNSKSHWVISQRNTSSVLVLSRSFKLLYKFGVTEPSDLKFESPNDLFYNQHDVHQIEPHGNFLIFDDGTTRPESQGGNYSRAIEFKLDWSRKLLKKVWEFRPEEKLVCNDGGSARRLENGHTIVDFGASNLSLKHVYEVDKVDHNAIVDFQISSKDSNNQWLLYRAIPIDSLFGEHIVSPQSRPAK